MICPFCKSVDSAVYDKERMHSVCKECDLYLASPYLELDAFRIKLILDFLSDQYISYENVPLIKLVREMREWYESQL